MAAILRFGAEELFGEDEAAAERQGHAVVEEDLDAILARAEVGGRGGGPGWAVERGGEGRLAWEGCCVEGLFCSHSRPSKPRRQHHETA